MLLLMSNYHVDAFLKNHNIYNICLSKTLLGSTVPINDENITIDWYSLLEAKHPNDTKRGGAGMFFKESLLLIKRIDLTLSWQRPWTGFYMITASVMKGLTTRKECSLISVNEKNKKYFFACHQGKKLWWSYFISSLISFSQYWYHHLTCLTVL